MSVATALTDLSGRIQDAYTALAAKGATMPATRNSYNLSSTIDTVPSGGGAQGYTLTIWGDSNSSSPWSSYAFSFSDGTLQLDETQTDKSLEDVPMVLHNVVSYAGFDNRGNFQSTPTVLAADTTITVWIECLLAGTLISLADGTQKKIEDIAFDDEILVWDFDNGCLTAAKPLWVKKAEIVDYMYEINFASGNSINVTGPKGHRAFNLDESNFVYLNDSVGQKVKTIDGEDEVMSCEKKTGEFEFYNIITNKHFNLFANGILTSCRLNNYRKFDGMKFAESPKVYHAKDDFKGIPDSYIEGLRLCEQPIDVDELNAYVRRLLTNAK